MFKRINKTIFLAPVVFLAIFLLAGCGSKSNIYEESAHYISCDYSQELLTFRGYKNKDECKILNEAIYKQILDECSNDFSSNKLDEKERKWFYEKCIEYSLDKATLKDAESYAEFLKTKK